MNCILEDNRIGPDGGRNVNFFSGIIFLEITWVVERIPLEHKGMKNRGDSKLHNDLKRPRPDHRLSDSGKAIGYSHMVGVYPVKLNYIFIKN